MGEVRGPYSILEWATMHMLRTSIPRLEKKNNQFGGRYSSQIECERSIYTGYLLKSFDGDGDDNTVLRSPVGMDVRFPEAVLAA